MSRLPTSGEKQRVARFKELYDEGSLPALARVVELCEMRSLPLPPWASEAIILTIQVLMMERKTGRGGRHARESTAYAENQKHYARWNAVQELRERKNELRHIAANWPQTYAAAAENLEGTAAAGSEEAMAKSYKLVNASFKKKQGSKFVTFDFEEYFRRRPSSVG